MKKIITLLLVVWATTATAATIAVPRTILLMAISPEMH